MSDRPFIVREAARILTACWARLLGREECTHPRDLRTPVIPFYTELCSVCGFAIRLPEVTRV